MYSFSSPLFVAYVNEWWHFAVLAYGQQIFEAKFIAVKYVKKLALGTAYAIFF